MKRSNIISKICFFMLFFALTTFCFSVQISYADAPQDVNIKYDSAAQTLSVTIAHKSSFPSVHHIKIVEITKNGTVVSTNKYETQPGEVSFTYAYKVEAAPGDKLEVTATCSLSGSKTATFTVPPAANAGK